MTTNILFTAAAPLQKHYANSKKTDVRKATPQPQSAMCASRDLKKGGQKKCTLPEVISDDVRKGGTFPNVASRCVLHRKITHVPLSQPPSKKKKKSSLQSTLKIWPRLKADVSIIPQHPPRTVRNIPRPSPIGCETLLYRIQRCDWSPALSFVVERLFDGDVAVSAREGSSL